MMKRKALQSMSFFLILFPLLAPLRAATVHVDDSAPPGGDGSAAAPVQTIQEGIALLPVSGGKVIVKPGTYIGPILVERDGVTLLGDATPLFDEDGFLIGFDDEVLITMDRPLGFPNPEPEDIIELRGSDNQVRNVVVEKGNFPLVEEASAFSAKAEDDDFYDGIVFRNILVGGEIDTAGWSRKANVEFANITALDGGFVGINPTADGNVKVRKADLANWSFAGVLFLGLWEFPPEENGPSDLIGEIRESRITGTTFGPPALFGLLVLGQGRHTNPDAPSMVRVDARGNTFQFNMFGIRVQPAFIGAVNTANRFLSVKVKDNSYSSNLLSNASVTFQHFLPILFPGPYPFAFFSTVSIEDKDSVFPPAVDLGPPENGNVYQLE
jgi:hypothetical protein